MKSNVASSVTWRARSLRENRGAFEHAHENDGLAAKVARDFGGEFRHALSNLFAGEQNLKFRH